MASDKRDFSDFNNFPGEIIRFGAYKGWYKFPELRSLDSMDRTRTWKIYVRLITTKDGKAPARRKINWDTDVDTVVPIQKIHFDNLKKDIPKNTIAQMWTVNGIESDEKMPNANIYKAMRSIPTYVIKGKNLGKKNETTVFTQALISARSKYLKKKQATAIDVSKDRFFPVAVHKYDKSPKDENKHIKYPVVVQRKLDGGRAVAYWNSGKKKTQLYTRKLKDLDGNEKIVNALTTVFAKINKKYPGAYLDGEIYKHGLTLQEISGIMRREVDSKTGKKEKEKALENDVKLPELEYHIFDVFFPKGSKEMKEMPLIERKIILDDIFKIVKPNKLIKKVKTFIAKNKEEETALYERFLEEKYEGSIVKNLNSLYEFSPTREVRSYQMRKRKPRYSAEYEVIGYTEGDQGKDKGAIIWILKTKGCPNPQKGAPRCQSKQFTSTPVGMDYEERYKLFKEMTPAKFNKNYKGKMMTVEYDDISKDGVPLRAKTKGIRLLD